MDYLLITVRAPAGGGRGRTAGALGDALVVPFLNGVDYVAWLRERYPPDQVGAGTIRVEPTWSAPG